MAVMMLRTAALALDMRWERRLLQECGLLPG
jgi:hypothetical protein